MPRKIDPFSIIIIIAGILIIIFSIVLFSLIKPQTTNFSLFPKANSKILNITPEINSLSGLIVDISKDTVTVSVTIPLSSISTSSTELVYDLVTDNNTIIIGTPELPPYYFRKVATKEFPLTIKDLSAQNIITFTVEEDLRQIKTKTLTATKIERNLPIQSIIHGKIMSLTSEQITIVPEDFDLSATESIDSLLKTILIIDPLTEMVTISDEGLPIKITTDKIQVGQLVTAYSSQGKPTNGVLNPTDMIVFRPVQN